MRWRNAETPWVTWLVVVLGLTHSSCVAPAREYDDTTDTTTTSSGGGTSVSTSVSTTSGVGGGAPEAVGHDVTAFVSGGVVASNGKHRMVLTVGEAARAPAMKNTKHRIQGGLVGAME